MLLTNFSENSKVVNELYKPINYKRAMKDSMQETWVKVIQEKFQSLLENQT